MGADGGSPTAWATAIGSCTPIVGDAPVGFLLGFEVREGLRGRGTTSLWRIGAPGRSELVGAFPTPGIFGVSVSTALKRTVVNTSEYHGDAWLTRVIRP